MTLSLPTPFVILPDGSADSWGLQRNFEALAQAAPDLGGRSAGFRFGYVTLTFNGTVLTDVQTITHGLGKTPSAILATTSVAPGGRPCAVSFSAYGATTFTLQAYAGTAPTGPIDCFWLVIG